MHEYVWLIPLLPLLAAGIGAAAPRNGFKLASGAAIGAMALAFLLSCGALATALGGSGRGHEAGFEARVSRATCLPASSPLLQAACCSDGSQPM